MAEQGKEPALHNEELEAAVRAFKAEQTNEKMLRIMTYLERATVMQPAVLPKDFDPQKIQNLIRDSQGGKMPVKLTSQTKPNPIVLKNDKGERFFAVFTGKGQIPEGQRYPAAMFLPFKECAKAALRKELGLSGIVLNPFTDNLVLHTAALEALHRKEAQILPEDRIARDMLSGRFYGDKAEFMERIGREKESFVFSCYEEAYRKLQGEKAVFPYRRDDFGVITLNISDTLHMARIALAEGGAVKGVILCAFCCYNPGTGEAVYYLIHRGGKGQKNRLLTVDEKGNCTDIGEAPEEGSELFELMGKVPWAENV